MIWFTVKLEKSDETFIKKKQTNNPLTILLGNSWTSSNS